MRQCVVNSARSDRCPHRAVPGSPNCKIHGGATPPGLIGLACGEIARYSDFLPSMMRLQRPAGTKFKHQTGLGPANPFNTIAQAFLDDPELKWLFLTNDDNLCPPGTIYRLLDHDVDVVSGLYFGRIQPFEPILFDGWTMEDLSPEEAHLVQPGVQGKRKWWHRHLMQPGEHGLIPASAVGDGCLLIKRRVLEALQPPWWEYGATMRDACDHDVVFSTKVVEAGFGLYCDLDLLVDHIANFAVRPHRQPDGTWEAHLVQADRVIALPAAHKGMDGK